MPPLIGPFKALPGDVPGEPIGRGIPGHGGVLDRFDALLWASVASYFVLKVALQYRGCPIPLPDLVSEGAMGLIRAIESFDHSRGLKFISYAVWWIKGSTRA